MSDSKELARHEQGGAVAQPQSESAQMLQMVIEAARDPNVDASKMEQMVNLTTKLQDRERETEFNRSKNAAIMEMPVITKDGRIIIRKQGEPERQQGRFAKFEDIDRVVRPILQRHNLALSFDIAERQQGGVTVRPILSHANGYTERGEAMPLPAETSGSKNSAQAVGSAVTYGKRYTMCAMLNIVTEGIDDDGNLGRATTVTLPFEREQLVVKEAEEAAAAGGYMDWFSSKGPKDRAWLVASGTHARLGGGAALPKPTHPDPNPDPDPEPVQHNQNATDAGSDKDRPAADPPSKENGTKTKTRAETPREWVDMFKADLGKRADMDKFDEYVDGKREALGKLQASDPALWQECQDAIHERRDVIADGRLV